jgi:hypothetical protein
VVKNWLNDPHLSCSTNVNFKNYIKVEVALSKENCELMKNINILKS